MGSQYKTSNSLGSVELIEPNLTRPLPFTGKIPLSQNDAFPNHEKSLKTVFDKYASSMIAL